MGSLFGGSSSSQHSYNTNNGMLTSGLGSTLGAAGAGSSALSNLLLNGDTSGFDKFKQNAGFNAAAQQGTEGVLQNQAARGLLRSGSSGRALVKYGNDLSSQYLGNYMQNLLGLSGLGIQAGGVLSDAGKVTDANSHQKNGLGGLIGGLASGIAASDRAVKKNISRIGELPSGLPVYTYQYKWGGPTRTGVMADEVEQLQPDALGPIISGMQTVDYSKLEGWAD